MSTSLLTPVELRCKGFEALVKSLGWINAVRFIQQFEQSSNDYTAERDRILPNWEPAELIRRVSEVGK